MLRQYTYTSWRTKRLSDETSCPKSAEHQYQSGGHQGTLVMVVFNPSRVLSEPLSVEGSKESDIETCRHAHILTFSLPLTHERWFLDERFQKENGLIAFFCISLVQLLLKRQKCHVNGCSAPLLFLHLWYGDLLFIFWFSHNAKIVPRCQLCLIKDVKKSVWTFFFYITFH